MGAAYYVPFYAFLQYGNTFPTNKVNGSLNFIQQSSVAPVLSSSEFTTSFGISPRVSVNLVNLVELGLAFYPNLTMRAIQKNPPFSGRSTFPNPNAKAKFGDCLNKHFVEYNITGYLSAEATAEVYLIGKYVNQFPLISVDLITGCAFTTTDYNMLN